MIDDDRLTPPREWGPPPTLTDMVRDVREQQSAIYAAIFETRRDMHWHTKMVRRSAIAIWVAVMCLLVSALVL